MKKFYTLLCIVFFANSCTSHAMQEQNQKKIQFAQALLSNAEKTLENSFLTDSAEKLRLDELAAERKRNGITIVCNTLIKKKFRQETPRSTLWGFWLSKNKNTIKANYRLNDDKDVFILDPTSISLGWNFKFKHNYSEFCLKTKILGLTVLGLSAAAVWYATSPSTFTSVFNKILL